MKVLSFDDYFYNVWELVPYTIVNEYTYDRNRDLIKEMTFGLWEIYKNTFKIDDYEFMTSEMSTERAAKILTRVFESVQKLGIRL